VHSDGTSTISIHTTCVDFFAKLRYVIPTQQALGKPLLNSVYSNTKDQVEEITRDLELGLVTNKLTDFSLNRLPNYFFLLLDSVER
jgi:hypothetical protein